MKASLGCLDTVPKNTRWCFDMNQGNRQASKNTPSKTTPKTKSKVRAMVRTKQKQSAAMCASAQKKSD
jgi:hypothetical protein